MTTLTRPRPAVQTKAPRPSGRRTGGFGVERRPGWLTYTLVAVFFIAGAYPLYWTFIMGSSDKSAMTETWPPLLPGGQFWKNVAVVFDTDESLAASPPLSSAGAE